MKPYTGAYSHGWYEAVIRPKGLFRAYNQTASSEIDERAKILDEFFLEVGENCIIEQPMFIDIGTNISIGDNFYAANNLTILDFEKVTIGDNVVIGSYVVIAAVSHPTHPSQRFRTSKYAICGQKPINIGNNVRIGSNTVILPGVNIGDNAVVEAGSVVTKDVLENSYVSGRPAKIAENK